MIVTVAGFKGGIGKSTTAIHIAGYLHQLAPTLLVDGDPNRSATTWARHGKLPFTVVDERQATKHAREGAYEHIIFDTKARPERDELKQLVAGCDFMIIPSSPETLAVDALLRTVDDLQALGSSNYRILITMVPPIPNRDGEALREQLQAADLPIFSQMIPLLAAFRKATADGVLVRDVDDPRAPRAWQSYEDACKEVFV
jgi:chromosome partitioning protein